MRIDVFHLICSIGNLSNDRWTKFNDDSILVESNRQMSIWFDEFNCFSSVFDVNNTENLFRSNSSFFFFFFFFFCEEILEDLLGEDQFDGKALVDRQRCIRDDKNEFFFSIYFLWRIDLSQMKTNWNVEMFFICWIARGKQSRREFLPR